MAILKNNRDICVGGKGHNYGLPDCLTFLWESLNETVKLDFWDFAAAVGDSVAMVYNRKPSTYCGYCVSGYLAGPEHIAYVFDVIGYKHNYIKRQEINTNKEKYLQEIVKYIDNGLPVLVLSTLAEVPGWRSDVGDYCLIVGYENNGTTLLLNVGGDSKNLLQYNTSDIIGMDWIFIGEKQREFSLENFYLETIKKMNHWLTLPEYNSMFFGAKAFLAWADDIERGRYDEKSDLWGDYSVYVCNLATSPAIPFFVFKKLYEINPNYSHLLPLHDEIIKLFPSYKPDDITPDESRDGLWSELEHLGGGFNITHEILCDKEKRSRIAIVLRNYSIRLDKVVDMLKKNYCA
jgi:hypothetical protein